MRSGDASARDVRRSREQTAALLRYLDRAAARNRLAAWRHDRWLMCLYCLPSCCQEVPVSGNCRHCRDYIKKLLSYRQRTWTSGTGRTGLSYEEALTSEYKARGAPDQVKPIDPPVERASWANFRMTPLHQWARRAHLGRVSDSLWCFFAVNKRHMQLSCCCCSLLQLGSKWHAPSIWVASPSGKLTRFFSQKQLAEYSSSLQRSLRARKSR